MSALSFDLNPFLQQGESLKLGNALEIPRYGSLTVEESLLLQQYYSSTQDASNLEISIALTTILFRSRLDRTWTAEQTLKLPTEWIEKATEFLLNEQSRWGSIAPKPEEDSDAKKPIDWDEIFWKLQQAYPGHPRFNYRHFAQCPIALIEKALEYADRLELQRMSLASRAIANVGVILAASNGVKNPQPRWFNDCEMLLFVEQSRQEIPQVVARSFMRLERRGKVPEWVYDFVDLEVMKASAGAID